MTAELNSSGVGCPFSVMMQSTMTSAIVMMLFTSISLAILSLIFMVSSLACEAVALELVICDWPNTAICDESCPALELLDGAE